MSKIIKYDDGDDLEQFMLSAKELFENSEGGSSKHGRIYAIPGESLEQLDDRVHLKTTEDLKAQIAKFTKDPSSVDFFYFEGNASPQATPVATVSSATRKRARDAESDVSSISSNNSRGSAQKSFTDSLKQRDGEMCVVCDNTLHLIGSHIIDVKHKLTGTDLAELRISGSYDLQNGLLLCGTCHTAYDAQLFGIDARCTVRVPVLTLESATHTDWRRYDGKVLSPRTEKGCWVSAHALQRKYDKYEEKQNTMSKQIISHPYVCKHCTKRYKSDRS